MLWTVAEHNIHGACARLAAWAARLRTGTAAGPPLARVASVLYLAALAILAMTAWHDPAAAASGFISGLPGWHLAFLMATGSGVALLTLTRPDTAGGELRESETEPGPTAGLSDLMAQMSHELRTPLNAVIGFSELMLRELHGPLGNARYQEYAHHISESGGRLLKSSEEALAVTEAMTALMADRGGAKRERRIAASLVRDAWRSATSALGSAAPRLILTTCATCDLTCERRPTVQALDHLLREALARATDGGAVTVTGRRQGGRRSVEIRVERGSVGWGSGPSPQAGQSDADEASKGSDPRSSLRIILARLLLEMQGASVECTAGPEDWTARIAFPGQR
jgi:signal transduction histidine kinase